MPPSSCLETGFWVCEKGGGSRIPLADNLFGTTDAFANDIVKDPGELTIFAPFMT